MHVPSTDLGVSTDAGLLTSAATFPKYGQLREVPRVPSHTGGRAFLKVLPSFCTRCVLFISLLTALPDCKTHLGAERRRDCLCAEPAGTVLYCQLQDPTGQGATLTVFPGFLAFFPLTNGNKAFPRDSRSSPQSKS